MMYPKHQYIRSKKLMEAYRKIECQHCGRDDGSVCGAHSNWGRDHKGMGIKADDSKCASLCSYCHIQMLDQGKHLDKEERETLWSNAHRKTVNALVKGGLWPADVKVPDMLN